MKRPGILFALAMLLIMHSTAQEAYPNLNEGSIEDNFLYRITATQAQTLITSTNSLSKIGYDDTAYFRDFAGLINDKTDIQKKAFGHYLVVGTKGSRLTYEYVQVSPYLIFLPDNHTDFLLQVRDKRTGIPVKDLKVRIDGHKAGYEMQSGLYRLDRCDAEGLLEISDASGKYFYTVEKSNYGPSHKKYQRAFLSLAPFRQLTWPFLQLTYFPLDLYRSIKYHEPYGVIGKVKWKLKSLADWKRSRKYYDIYHHSYFFFSKPEYKLQDTVRFKALILDKRKKQWEHRPLYAYFEHEDKRYFLACIQPVRGSAGYYYAFHLADSMQVRPGGFYRIALYTKDSTLAAFERVRIEDYELPQAKYTISSNGEDHYRGVPYTLSFHARDANDLPLKDAKAEVDIRLEEVSNVQDSSLFLPYRLWHYETVIDNGELNLPVPDSIFGRGNATYRLNAVLRNSSNEREERSYYIHFHYQEFGIRSTIEKDSLRLEGRLQDSSIRSIAALNAYDRYDNLLSSIQITLPYTCKINPLVARYECIATGAQTKVIDMESQSADLPACAMNRTADSLHLFVSNPLRIPFHYQLFRANKEILKGTMNEALWLNINANAKDQYTFALEYVWAGEVSSELFECPYKDKEATLTVAQPEVVYPGKEVEITVTATDNHHKPVKDMSILAFAHSNRFGSYNGWDLPDLSNKPKAKSRLNSFEEGAPEQKIDDGLLNHSFWKKRMQLDTLPFYRFRYPQGIRSFTFPSEDSITQFAPFIMCRGELLPVYYVLIDGLPVYFGFTDFRFPYSFVIDPGKAHQVQVRVPGKLIVLDSLRIQAFQKTIISLDPEYPIPHMSIIAYKGSGLSEEEIRLYSKNIISLDPLPYDHYSFIGQEGDIALMPLYQRKESARYTAGPVASGACTFYKPGQHIIPFVVEPGFEYHFAPAIVRMKSTREALIPINPGKIVPSPYEWVIDRKKMEALFKAEQSAHRQKIVLQDNFSGNAQLYFELEEDHKPDNFNPIASILLLGSTPSPFARVSSGLNRKFSDLPAGAYELILLMADGSIRKSPLLETRKDGISFYRVAASANLDSAQIRALESCLRPIILLSDSLYTSPLSQLSSIYITGKVKAGILYHASGLVLDRNNEPIPGAAIRIPGTPQGTITDVDGLYELDIPTGAGPNVLLEINALGFKRETISAGYNIRTVLDDGGSNTLSEVYVIEPYGIAGGTLPRAPRQEQDLEEADDLPVSNEPHKIPTGMLYVINGKIFRSNLSALAPDAIAEMKVLTGASETAIYGPEGANGVVLLTLKKGIALPPQIQRALEEVSPVESAGLMHSSLRRRFRDDAFWLPDLKTDSNGVARFKVVFPDDLASWKTFYYATDEQRHTGYANGNIRSYKPLTASLQTPSFLLVGDSVSLVGKLINFAKDTPEVKASYFRNDSLAATHSITLFDHDIKLLPLVATNTDSIRLKYMLQKDNGYFDGEEQSLPILPLGTPVADGSFMRLDGDTSLLLDRCQSGDTLYITASASLYQIVDEEITRVKDYAYFCNEQLASKINALLCRQRITVVSGKGFNDKDRRYIQEMIDLLIKRCNGDKLWGWWAGGRTIPWISTHVIATLNEAASLHYRFNKFNFEQILEPLIYAGPLDTAFIDVQSLQLLQYAGIKLNYEHLISRLEQKAGTSLYDRLQLIRLRQKLGLPYNIGIVLTARKEDIYGNSYWQDTSSVVERNTVLATVAALEILDIDGGDFTSTDKIINWLLQQRSATGWRNTYEGSLIVAALSRHIRPVDASLYQPELRFSSSLLNDTIRSFPYTQRLNGGGQVHISKKGKAPVYFSWYYRHWDTTTASRGTDLLLHTFLQQKDKVTEIVEAGSPVQLKVKLTAVKSADYVMIEVPIPAGCSYNTRGQGSSGYEVHREYYQDHVNIFCEHLPEGIHEYAIDLLPKYKGRFTLNPAKAELMYFPVFYGKTALRRLEIQ